MFRFNPRPGNVDQDGAFDTDDIDKGYIDSGSSPLALYSDLDNDGDVDDEDAHVWVEDIYHSGFGNANLDWVIDVLDFGFLAAGFGQTAGWALGNFDGNDTVDVLDFGPLAENFGKRYLFRDVQLTAAGSPSLSGNSTLVVVGQTGATVKPAHRTTSVDSRKDGSSVTVVGWIDATRDPI